jgi:hypothetical protein
MRETTKKYIKHYSKLSYDIAAHTMFWSAVVGFVYLNVLYSIVYSNKQTVDK